jgi:hypothetical protein
MYEAGAETPGKSKETVSPLRVFASLLTAFAPASCANGTSE